MKKRILLVEADRGLVARLQMWLLKCGYDVILSASGGDEGILLAVTKSPDLILISSDLPIIGGWQAIKILKTSTVTRQIPVIALTSSTVTDAEWQQVLESGCNACELKPIDRTSLLSKIRILTEPINISPVTANPAATPKLNPLLFPKYRSAEFPFAMAAADFPGKRQAADAPGAMVVYVEDSPLDSQAMATIVQGAGHRYESIRDPAKTLPVLLDLKPDLVFLDLVMPFTSGYEVCSQIRRAAAFRGIPIIIITNHDGIIDRMRAKFVGASGFFGKPIRHEHVIDVLNKYLVALPSSLSTSFY